VTTSESLVLYVFYNFFIMLKKIISFWVGAGRGFAGKKKRGRMKRRIATYLMPLAIIHNAVHVSLAVASASHGAPITDRLISILD